MTGLATSNDSALSGGLMGVVNPATGEVFTEVPTCSAAELDRTFAAAAAALPGWGADESRRRALMLELATAIVAARDELTALLVLETGKPTPLAALEIRGWEMWLNYLAGVEMPRTVLKDDATARAEIRRRPVGVVAAIVAWNFPLSLAMTKITPALRAGATIVVKPSPFTPVATLRLGEIINEVLPPGVVSIVAGGDDLGVAMSSHPVPRKIAFTGSIAAGKAIAEAAGRDLKRVTLELGGNDAAIVLEDADLAAIAPALLQRAFFNVGQTCAIPKRIFAPASRYDEVVDAITAAAEAISLGTGPDAGMGPLSTRPQYDRVCELVAEAIEGGATAVTGGASVDGGGYFFEPTVLTGVEEGSRIVDEEQFGPAVPVLRYRDLDEAVSRANATMFGLCGSVWGADLDHATEVAERLECGVTYVNAHGLHLPNMPMLGAKWSGVGVENGEEGLLEYTQPQVVYRTGVPSNLALVE